MIACELLKATCNATKICRGAESLEETRNARERLSADDAPCPLVGRPAALECFAEAQRLRCSLC